MRYSDSFLRDVRFYLRNRHRFYFFGGVVRVPPYSHTGVSGVEAFRLFDTNGRYVSTKHPRLFVVLMRTKKSINWHIKEWADGFVWMCEPLNYYLNQFIDPPAWIKCSLEGAIEHVRKQKGSLADRLGINLRTKPIVPSDDLAWINIPVMDLYCVRCCSKPNATGGRKHIAKSNGSSWHYYCSECGLKYMPTTPQGRRQKDIEWQIISWVESQQRRMREDKS